MPLAFLLDENQRGLLWRAIQRHNRSSTYILDIGRVGDPTDLLLGTTDPEVLLWAENADRILVTFDKKTMATHLAAHLQTGRHSPGIHSVRVRRLLVMWPQVSNLRCEPNKLETCRHIVPPWKPPTIGEPAG
jgi:hypothetical protein